MSQTASARGIYQTPGEFIGAEFNGESPEVRVVWLDKKLRHRLETVLGHPYKLARIRYWRQNDKTVWVLNEIGKEEPITLGIVINNNEIHTVKVLIYRESRGSEVRHDFFTNQFKKARLSGKDRLNQNVDSISGASMSVRAIEKTARVALILHEAVIFENEKP